MVNALLPPPPPPPPRSRDKPNAPSRGWARPCQVRAKIHHSPKRGTAGVCRDRALATSPKTDTARVYCGEPSDSTHAAAMWGARVRPPGSGLRQHASASQLQPTDNDVVPPHHLPRHRAHHPRLHPSPGTIPDVITIAIAGVVTGTAANTPRRECGIATKIHIPGSRRPHSL